MEGSCFYHLEYGMVLPAFITQDNKILPGLPRIGLDVNIRVLSFYDQVTLAVKYLVIHP